MKLSERIALARAGYSMKEIARLEAEEKEEEKKKSDEDAQDESPEEEDPEDSADSGDDSSDEDEASSQDESEDKDEGASNYKELYEKAIEQLKEAQKTNRSIAKTLENKKKMSSSEYLDKAFEEIFD